MLTSAVWSVGKDGLQLKLIAVAPSLALSLLPCLSVFLPPSFLHTDEYEVSGLEGRDCDVRPWQLKKQCHSVSISLSPKRDSKSPIPQMVML